MSGFTKELKAARGAMGHKTARSFFDFLKTKGLSFNYSYYMQMEKGAIPSRKVVEEIAYALKGEWVDRLILAYCQSLFPKQSYLFPLNSPRDLSPEPDTHQEIPKTLTPVLTGQKELTPKQVAVIASSEINYQLFLLASLARRPIPEKDISQWFSSKEIHVGLKQLEQAKIVRISDAGFEATSIESKFPEAYSKELKEAYQKFDQWDERFGECFALSFVLNKMLIRRVSGRYISIISKQLDLLSELLRSSDEVDSRYNENVLQLKLVLRQGRLPG